jgi:hypothetical protein
LELIIEASILEIAWSQFSIIPTFLDTNKLVISFAFEYGFNEVGESCFVDLQ